MLLVSFYTHENNRKLEVLLYFQGVYKASNGKQWVKRKLWKSNSEFSAWILIESYHLLLLVLILVLHLLTQILSLIHLFSGFSQQALYDQTINVQCALPSKIYLHSYQLQLYG